MNRKMSVGILCLLAALTMGLGSAWAEEKVATVTRPDLQRTDGKPVDMTKPVKVFILLGQSNMVGMGNIFGDKGENLTPPASSTFTTAESKCLTL